MKNIKSTANTTLQQSGALWKGYLKHLQQNEGVEHTLNDPSLFEIEFWRDYELLVKDAQQMVHKPTIPNINKSQQVLDIYHRFWSKPSNNINFVFTKTMGNVSWHRPVRIMAVITAILGLINIEAGQLLVPLGVATLFLSFRIEARGRNALQPAKELQTKCSLNIDASQLVYKQVDSFANEYTFTIKLHNIVDVQITTDFLTIKSSDTYTREGKIPNPSNQEYSSSWDMSDYKHLVHFLFEVVHYNRTQKLLNNQIQNTIS
ncbi:hypothetical protein BKI52_09530 [marine bacterium AO1-C]|nr:hypothetical protein BKI52_09530 [marine bacterium AO1-C]